MEGVLFYMVFGRDLVALDAYGLQRRAHGVAAWGGKRAEGLNPTLLLSLVAVRVTNRLDKHLSRMGIKLVPCHERGYGA